MNRSGLTRVADYEAHGLYNAGLPDAARLELLDFLVSEGVDLDEIAAADREDRLSSILTDDRLIGRPTLTLADVSARVNQDPDLISRVWRASGIADPDPTSLAFTETDVEMLAIFGSVAEVFGEAPALQLARVVGSSLARIAEAEISTALTNVDGAYSPASQVDEIRTSASLLALIPAGETAIMHLLRRHIAAANRRLGQARTLDSSGDVVDLSVGFADLVDSTQLSMRLDWSDFAAAMTSFDALTSDIVTSGGGRVVKLLGDEVMFVAPHAQEACQIGLALLDAFAQHTVFRGVRVGLASGPVVARDGDYFGTVVHLAARLVNLATPGSLAVPESLAKIAADIGCATRSLGPHRMQGFPDALEVWAAEPA